MTLSQGQTLPDATFHILTEDGPAKLTTAEVFDGKKVVVFALPGAFTPTCHRNHMPGYIKNHAAIMAKGVDKIVCITVCDLFVLQAWSESLDAGGKVEVLSDGNAEFTKAAGMDIDLSVIGLATRSTRYSMLVENRVITAINIEEDATKAGVSSAEVMLEQLG